MLSRPRRTPALPETQAFLAGNGVRWIPTDAVVDEDYLRHLHGGVSLEPEVAVRPARVLVGLRTRFFGADSEKNDFATKLPDLWGRFMPRLAEIASGEAPVGYGVIQQTPEHGEELEYLAAIEVDAGAAVPDGMVRYELPAARYATFLHRGHLSLLDTTVNYIYSSWLSRSGLRHTYGPDVEVYGPGYRHEASDSEVHYAIPVAEQAQCHAMRSWQAGGVNR